LSLRRAGVTGLSFEGRGERIARGFYIPVLMESVEYDRATGYFSVESLVHAAGGVAGLIISTLVLCGLACLRGSMH